MSNKLPLGLLQSHADPVRVEGVVHQVRTAVRQPLAAFIIVPRRLHHEVERRRLVAVGLDRLGGLVGHQVPGVVTLQRKRWHLERVH